MKNKYLMALVAKQRIKLWDWVVCVKNTSCKATYKIKDLKLLNATF